MEEDEEIQELDAEEQQVGEQPRRVMGSGRSRQLKQGHNKPERNEQDQRPIHLLIPQILVNLRYGKISSSPEGEPECLPCKKKLVADSKNGTSSMSRHVKK